MPVLMWRNVNLRPLSKFVIFIICFTKLQGYLWAQQSNEPVFDIQVEKASPIAVFEEIEAQSSFRFMYNAESLDSLGQSITLNIQHADLQEVLSQIKEQTTLKFKRSGYTIAVAIRKQPKKQETLSGFITDSVTGEYLIGAIVYLPEYNVGATSNQFGYYSLSYPVEQAIIKVQYLGYKTIVFSHTFGQSANMNFRLPPRKSLIKEVIVSTTNTQDIINDNVEGVNKIGVRDLRNLPVTYSEKDIVKSTHYLPGISRMAGGSSGYSVRGASPSENMTIFDNTSLYNISHTIADLSIFNPDIVQNMRLYKGGIPAKFGGRSSSVLNVAMRNGNKKHFAASGGVSLVSTRLAIEGPVFKEKLSYLLSVRRSNLGWVKLADSDIQKYYFHDINAKLHYTINAKHTLALSGYFGKDHVSYDPAKSFYLEEWLTQSATLNWNYVGRNFFANTSAVHTNYTYSMYYDNFDGATIRDVGGKQDFSWYLGANNIIDFGWGIMDHLFNTNADSDNLDSTLGNYEYANNVEGSLYVSHRWKINKKLNASYGVRLSHFGKVFNSKVTFDNSADSTIQGITFEEAFKDSLLNRFTIEPRVALSYKFSNRATLKGSYNRMAQNLHQVSYVGTENNRFFVWVPSTASIKPLITDQISLGFYGNKNASVFSYSIEAFYKKSRNNLTYFSDSTDNNELVLESQLLTTKGRAFGIEFFTRITKGNFKGNLSYTLSKSERQSSRVNKGKWYPSNYHKPHNLAINLNYKLSNNWSISVSWLYSTGMASSVSYSDLIHNNIHLNMDKINQYRLPDYHRLDLGITYENQKKQHQKFRTSWSFNVYNIYNRANGYIGEGISQATSSYYNNTAMFYDYGIMPSVSFNFHFR